MNTGERNIHGRRIFRGPRGGEYVLGAAGQKIRTFTKATAAAAPVPAPAPAPAAAPRVNANTFTHKGIKFTRMANATSYGVPVYKKAGVDTYYTIPATGARVPSHMLLGTMINKTNGTKISLRNYKKTKAAGVAAPAPAPAPAARTSPGPVRLTTAERNARLAAIRARLNAMRAAKLAAMPKRRANVEKKLKNAVARVRSRLRGNKPTESTMTVPFCHEPASVPRKACTLRKANISVYTSPMVRDGSMLATRASDIDLDWFKRQDAYVKNLSDYDFWTAQAHTNRSHSWIGPFLYRKSVPSTLPGADGKHIVPLWPQIRKLILDGTFRADGPYYTWITAFKSLNSETARYNLYKSNTRNISPQIMKRALEMYRDDLKRIIAGAPKSRKKMILYRGASFDIFLSTKGHWHNLESFCSAAYDLNHALAYEGGTMQRITVLPGTPVLLVAGMNQWNYAGEYEIMVNFGTKYLIRSRAVKRSLWTGYRRMSRVTDVTIAK